MNILITRLSTSDDGTVGRLEAENGFTCDTLELAWLDNVKGISCINADTYQAWLWHSPMLNRPVFRLEDKHGRADCLIHNGNWAGRESKGEYTNVHGCTLVGRGYQDVKNPNGDMQFAILRSVRTLEELITSVGEGPHQVTYIWQQN